MSWVTEGAELIQMVQYSKTGRQDSPLRWLTIQLVYSSICICGRGIGFPYLGIRNYETTRPEAVVISIQNLPNVGSWPASCCTTIGTLRVQGWSGTPFDLIFGTLPKCVIISSTSDGTVPGNIRSWVRTNSVGPNDLHSCRIRRVEQGLPSLGGRPSLLRWDTEHCGKT